MTDRSIYGSKINDHKSDRTKHLLKNVRKILNRDISAMLDLYHCNFNFDKWAIRRYRTLFGLDLYPDSDLMININNFWYNVDRNLPIIAECSDYTGLNHITKDDIVIDIGANIGGFALPASELAKQVVAIEPVLSDRLKKNIAVNNIENITVIDRGLGNGEIKKIKWMDKTVEVQTLSLSDILEQYGGTILKCDCEGGEWNISPEELEQIRHIDIEFHYTGSENQILIDYIKNEYLVETSRWHGPGTEIYSGFRVGENISQNSDPDNS